MFDSHRLFLISYKLTTCINWELFSIVKISIVLYKMLEKYWVTNDINHW
jgi:hypothetical protein